MATSLIEWHSWQSSRGHGPLVWSARILLLGVALLACGFGDTRAAPPAPVDIRDFHYLPSILTVPMGSTVRWTNHDEETHTVSSDTGLFGSAGLELEEGYTYTFTAPGRYPYACDLHPQMRGTIVVE